MKIKRIIFSIGVMCMVSVAFSQTDSTAPVDTVYESTAVDEDAKYPGGDAAMDRYIDKNMVFSDRAYKFAKSGTVIIGFIVEKDGSLSHIRCLHRRKVGYGVEESCMKIFEQMPAWQPAKIDGKPVRLKTTKSVRMNL